MSDWHVLGVDLMVAAKRRLAARQEYLRLRELADASMRAPEEERLRISNDWNVAAQACAAADRDIERIIERAAKL